MRRLSGLTVIISTHYMDEAERLCDRLLVIDRGRLVAEGPPRDLVTRSFSNYALEVRDAADLPLRTDGLDAQVRATTRAGAHLYFAPSPELLTPLMRFYEGRRVLLRPSSLEDFFLDIVGDTNEDGQGGET